MRNFWSNLLGCQVIHWEFDGSPSDFHIVNPTVRLAGGHISGQEEQLRKHPAAAFRTSPPAPGTRNNYGVNDHLSPGIFSCSPTSTWSATTTASRSTPWSARFKPVSTASRSTPWSARFKPVNFRYSSSNVRVFQKQHNPNWSIS